MRLFLALLWCASVAGRGSGLRIIGGNSRNSRLGEFNSRLGRGEFPVRPATGIHRQPTDFAYPFSRPNGSSFEEIAKIHGSTGITGNVARPN
jgi:hypothetical protein